MGIKMKIKINLIIIFLLTLIISSCKEDKLTPLTKYAREFLVNAEVNFCTLPPESKRSYLKFIFVVDKSTSNQFIGVNPGTDIAGTRRYDSIMDFLDNSPDDTMTSYSLITFGDDADAIENDGNGLFFTNKIQFINRVQNEKNRSAPLGICDEDHLWNCSNDIGWTNYDSALAVIRSRIISDIETSIERMVDEIISSHYIVIFTTDGLPEDENGPAATNPILLSTENIVQIAEDDNYKAWAETIKVNTGYYYNTEDVNASDLLRDMADHGNGDFYSFGAGYPLDFQRFAVPIRNVKHSLKDIFLINKNITWDVKDGLIKNDTDGDGISDEIEILIGSNWQKNDSDDNGVSDAVEYYSTGKPCADISCDPLLAEPYASCSGFIKADWIQGSPDKYYDLDKDGLNNCEEIAVLESRTDNFDSNNDWIPDELAFRFGGISYLPGIVETGRLLDSDSDGIDNYTELKLNTPWNFNNNDIAHLKTPTYNLSIVNDEIIRTCYKFKATGIPSVGEENTIKVYIVEKSSIIDDRRFIRTAEKQVTMGNLNVTFTDEDFL